MTTKIITIEISDHLKAQSEQFRQLAEMEIDDFMDEEMNNMLAYEGSLLEMGDILIDALDADASVKEGLEIEITEKITELYNSGKQWERVEETGIYDVDLRAAQAKEAIRMSLGELLHQQYQNHKEQQA